MAMRAHSLLCPPFPRRALSSILPSDYSLLPPCDLARREVIIYQPLRAWPTIYYLPPTVRSRSSVFYSTAHPRKLGRELRVCT